jgi:hypothetical protein
MKLRLYVWGPYLLPNRLRAIAHIGPPEFLVAGVENSEIFQVFIAGYREAFAAEPVLAAECVRSRCGDSG